MEFLECCQTRRSVRRYLPKKVERETVRGLVQAASHAPSWKNSQTTRYIVIDDETLIQNIACEGCLGFTFNQKTIENTPCLVVVATVEGHSGYEQDGSFSTAKGTHWESFDAGIATQTFCLAAWDKGLATVILGIFDETYVAKRIALPEGQKISALVALGYPDETPSMPKRKAEEELLLFR